MDYDWRDFKARHGGVEGARAAFENACESLLRRMHPNLAVNATRANPGDEGIDIYVGNLGQEPITVYQCKFHIEQIGNSQKHQIRDSFLTARASKKFAMEKWVLCIPKVLDIDESLWWERFRSQMQLESGISIDLLNGNQLLTNAKFHSLFDVWFNVNAELNAELKRISQFMAQVPKALERLSSRLRTPKPLGRRIPPTIGKVFVDADNRLAILSEHFLLTNGSRRSAVPPLALVANGGEGKSRAAVEFAHKYANIYETQLMVNASSQATLRQQIAELARISALGIATEFLGEDEKISAVLAQLPQLETSGLLIIFDGVDDDETAIFLKGLFRQLGSAHIIITTRFRKWGRSIVQAEMPKLLPAEANRYLIESGPPRDFYSNEEITAIRDLAETFGYLPLALESAAAYLRVEGGTYMQYLDTIRKDPASPLKWKDSLELEYPVSVLNAYQVTWDRIKEKNPYAYSILIMSSFFSLAPIPSVVWPNSFQVGNHGTKEFQDFALNWDLAGGLKTLLDYSQIQEVNVNGLFAYTLHPVIRTILRAGIPENAFLQVLAGSLSLLSKALEGDVEHPEIWERWELLRTHLVVLLQDAEKIRIAHPTTSLLSTLGNYLVARGAYDKAEPVLQRALEIDELAWGAQTSEWLCLFEQPNVCEIFAEHLSDLARLLRKTNRNEKAGQLLKKAIAVLSAQNSDSPMLGMLQHDLGLVVCWSGDTKAAEHLLRTALERDESNRRHADKDIDLNVARDLHSLGRVLLKEKRLDEAEELLCRALRIHRRWRNRFPRKRTVGTVAMGLDGPRTLDESWSAESTAERQIVFKVPRWLGGHYGRYTPETAKDLCAIAQLRIEQSRPEEAKKLFEVALGIYWYTWGPLHPEMEATWNERCQLENEIQGGDGEARYGDWVIGLIIAEIKELTGRANR